MINVIYLPINKQIGDIISNEVLKNPKISNIKIINNIESMLIELQKNNYNVALIDTFELEIIEEYINRIMATHPIPILIIQLGMGNTGNTPEYFNYGLVDIFQLNIPNINNMINYDKLKISPLVSIKLVIMSKLNIEKFAFQISQINKKVNFGFQQNTDRSRHIANIYSKLNRETVVDIDSSKYMDHTKLVVIGASTGGPKLLSYIISQFPSNFPPVLVVQHMPEGYIGSFAERINKNSRINVKKAAMGDIIKPGNVYIAPGGYHMELEKHGNLVRIQITDGAKVNFVKPSVDVTLFSAARIYGSSVIAVILTGMGSDGREGCRVVKKMKGKVIALNEQDSVIYGMNKSVVEAGLADVIVGMDDIVREIARFSRYKIDKNS